MRSLAGLSLRTLRRSTRRYLLTAVGASLGVAVLFAVLVTSDASRRALDDAIRGSAGSADVFIGVSGVFDATIPPGTPDTVAALDGVESIYAGVGFRSALRTEDELANAADAGSIRDSIVFVNGLDSGFETINDLAIADGRLPAEATPEIVIPRRLADRLDVSLDDTVALATPSTPASVTVVGLLEDTGAATANQGGVVYSSAPTVRFLLGNAEAVTGIQVDLADGVESEAWIDEHAEVLADVAVQDASELAAGFRTFITGINNALTLVAAIAVFIGGFLIYLTFAIAVAERTKVLGTLRALGATRAQVQRVVVLEAVLLGFVCGLIGLVIGYGLSAVSVGVVGGLLNLDLSGADLPVGSALFSVAVGVIVSAAAAIVPARRAARVDPVAAMRSGSLAIERSPRRWVGPTLLAVGVVLAVVTSGNAALGGLGMLALLAGAVLSVHQAVGPVARIVGAGTARLAKGTGGIAVRHLERERTRSSFTLALVMVALATILSVAAANLAMGAGLDEILDQQASAIQVGAPGAVDGSVASELAAIDGVDVVSPIRFGEMAVTTDETDSPSPINSFMQMIDPDTYFETSSLPYNEGDDATVRAALADGGAVVLPSTDANRLGVVAGDTVVVSTQDGPAPFDVVGVYAVIGGGFGTVVSDVDLVRLGGGRINGFLVSTGDADAEAVATTIRETVGRDHQLVIDTPDDTRAYANGQLNGFFSLAYAILFVAALISMLGLANTLVVTVLDRTREIGVLRSTGARRRQVAAMVTVEATTMAVVAFVLSLPLGALLAWGVISGQRETIASSISYQFPFGLVAPLLVVTVIVSALASLVPARRAARLEIVDTLRFE